MIKFLDNYFTKSDARGSIKGLINCGTWREINLIQSEANVVRGNHYHKSTIEGFIILSGRILVTLQRVSNGELIGEAIESEVGAGKVFIIETMVSHRFVTIESSEWINFLSLPINSALPDIHTALI